MLARARRLIDGRDTVDLDGTYREALRAFFREIAETLAAEGKGKDASTLLTNLYDELLGLRLARDSRTGDLALQPSIGRKRRGAYFTPPGVAGSVVRAALAPLSGAHLPRVLDPAMGTGVFLVAACGELSAHRDPAGVAEECLFGFDIDSVAVEIAILSLWLQTGASREVLTRHLRCADPLAMGADLGPPCKVVVGNPPWGRDFSEAERQALRLRFSRSTRGAFDSFKLFLDLGSAWTSGTLGMIVPQAVLAQSSHADIREVLLERLDLLEVRPVHPATFPGVAAPACALILGTRRRNGETSEASRRSGRSVGARRPVSRWVEDGFLLADGRLIALLRRLQSAGPSLGDLSGRYLVRDTGINYNRASVARRVLYEAESPQDRRDVPRYRGRNFHRYTAITRAGWVRHDAAALLQDGEELDLDWRTYRLAEKIVLRQTADSLIATLDRTQMALGRSVIAVMAPHGDSLLPLLACLNSSLMTALYRALSGEEGRVLPQVKVSRLKALPLPAVDIADAERREQWNQLGLLAAARLQCGAPDPEIEEQIDALVGCLYGLSDQEAAMVPTSR